MPRRVKDWVKGFCEFGKPFNTTSNFLEWSAVWQLATAVTRQVGSKLRGQLLTPNMFVALIAGPGAGKSQLVTATRQVFIPATSFNCIPSSITRAGLQDYMQDNLQNRKNPDGTLNISNECIALSEEMQGILPEHDIGHLTLYNELYDVRSVYKARTRSHGEINLQSPYCSIITGAQPAFLGTTLPEQAWGMGFMSRLIMVFDQARIRTSSFVEAELDEKLKANLILDLREISKLYGYFQWSQGARALYETWWVEKGGPPIPQAKRLAMGYNSRRELHFLKLAMAFSLSRSNDLVVTAEDAQRAIALLIKTEDRMKFIFTEMANTGSMVLIQDVLDMVRQAHQDGKRIHESTMVEMLMQRFQPNQVHGIIDNLLKAHMIAVAGGLEGKGFREFGAGKKLTLMS